MIKISPMKLPRVLTGALFTVAASLLAPSVLASGFQVIIPAQWATHDNPNNPIQSVTVTHAKVIADNGANEDAAFGIQFLSK